MTNLGPEFHEIRAEYCTKHALFQAELDRRALSPGEFRAQNEQNYSNYCKKMVEALRGHIGEPGFGPLRAAVKLRLKEDYWTQLVQISRRDIEDLRVRVNDLLKRDNGTNFLNMAYEEVLFPAVFLGKKKYFGIAHLKTENFHPPRDKYFIKGVDIIKRGQAQIAQTLGYEIVEDSLSVASEATMEEIVMSKLLKFFKDNWATSFYQFSGKYKLPKVKDGKLMPGNVSVLRFVQRMRELHKKYRDEKKFDMALDFEPPEVNDEFKYVIVEKFVSWDSRGYKTTPKKGDKMEFTRVYEKYSETMNIDQNYYFEKAILTLFARFLSYMPEFEPGAHIERETKEYDKAIITNASSYIKQKCIEHKFLGDANGRGRDKGALFRRINKALVSTFNDTFANIGGAPAVGYIGAVEMAQKKVEARNIEKLNKKGHDLSEDWNWIETQKGKDILKELMEIYRNRALMNARVVITQEYGKEYLNNLPKDILRDQRKEWTELRMRDKRAQALVQIRQAEIALERTILALNQAYSEYAGDGEYLVNEARNDVGPMQDKKEIAKFIAKKMKESTDFDKKSAKVSDATVNLGKTFDKYVGTVIQAQKLESIYSAFCQARAKETGIAHVETISKKQFMNALVGHQ